MKYLKLCTFTVLFSTIALSGLHAQNIDRERMNRDINIMESVLQELFKTKWNGSSNRLYVAYGNLTFGGKNEISGTYIPDYGVIFTIPARTSGYILSQEGNEYRYQFQYGNNDNDQKITKETISNRIKEFLRDYGSTISQLSGDDKVTVIYESNRSVTVFSGTKQNVNQSSKANKLPSTIYVTATASDLRAFRQGNISEDQFNNRLKASTIDEEDQHRDLKVMANILKTTFEDVGEDELRVRGSVKETYIEDLGALFYVDASYSSGSLRFNTQVIELREKLSKVARDTATARISSYSDEDNKSWEEMKKKRAKAYQSFVQQMKETLVDYGRTLKTVQSDEQVFVSISVSNSGDELPERVDLQIKKSALKAVDKGNMSREQAMSQITVREY